MESGDEINLNIESGNNGKSGGDGDRKSVV